MIQLSESPQAVIAAVEFLGALVRRVEAEEFKAATRALGAVADVVRERGDAEAERLSLEVDQLRMGPVDPSDLPCHPLGMLGRTLDEPTWTQWLGALMRPENGSRVAALTWRSLCEAACRRGTEEGRSTAGALEELATRDDWRAAADAPPGAGCVIDEAPQHRLGAIDLLISSPTMQLGVEVKLFEDWHDTTKGAQSERYRELVRRCRLDHQRLGLLVVTARDDFPRPGRDPLEWIYVHWDEVAQRLRANAKLELARAEDQRALLNLWPVLVTIQAIESGLYDLSPPVHQPTWRDIEQLVGVIEHREAT